MTTEEPTGGAPGLVERAQRILFQPGAEWDRIKGEQTSLGALLMGYILPLAVLSAICGIIGMAFVGVGMFGVSMRVPIVTAVVSGVLQVVFTLVGVFLLGLLINALAPSFGSTQDQGQANKLAAYSMTAGLIAGVFTIFPPIAILGILGLYSLVLLYIGLPRLMNTPADKRVGYFITILIIWIVGALVIGWAVTAARMAMPGMGMGGMMFGQARAPGGDAKVTLPGGVTIDTREAEKAAKQMEQAFGGAQAGGAVSTTPIDLARLSALLPETLPGGFTRTEMSSSSGGAMGMNVATAEATYVQGAPGADGGASPTINLTVMDMGAMGGVAGMAAAMGVQTNRQTSTGYESTQTVNGRVISEEVDRSAGTAHYQVITPNRVAVTADGTNVSIEQLRGAVNPIVGPAEALARGGG